MLQNATSKRGRGGRRKLPLAFTEHGAIMAATVLSSPRAVEMSIYVVRAFVKLRELLASNKDLARKLAALERSLESTSTWLMGANPRELNRETRNPLAMDKSASNRQIRTCDPCCNAVAAGADRHE